MKSIRKTNKIFEILIGAAMSMLMAVGAAVSQDWPTESTPEWEALLLAGQQEGELVLLGDASLSPTLIEKFEADTGIKIQFISAGIRDAQIRYFREVGSGETTIDAYLGGYSLMALVEKNLLAPIGDKFVLPEVTAGENWREGHVPFVDNAGRYLPLSSQYVSGKLLVNTDLVDIDSLKSWEDLLRPELVGKIAAHDPRVIGGGQSVAFYVDKLKGDEFIDSLYNGQEVMYSTDYRQITDWVARGAYAIGLSALPRDIDKYLSQGLTNLRVISLEDSPGYLVGGSSVLTVPLTAPHPNAAAVFANWFFSRPAQEIYSAAFNIPSDRVDVQTGTWPDFIVPEVGIEYVNIYTEDMRIETRDEILPRLKVILGEN